MSSNGDSSEKQSQAKSSSGQTKTKKAKYELVPLKKEHQSNNTYTRTKEITIPDLMKKPAYEVNLRNNVTLMLLRVISNKNGSKENQVRTYKQLGDKKISKNQPYLRLFSFMVFEGTKPTSRMVYLMEDRLAHSNMWLNHKTIRDNGEITIGSILRLYHVKPIETIMADSCPSLVTEKAVVAIKHPDKLKEVHIQDNIPAGVPYAFVLNNCKITILDSEPHETGCGGLFCDKQRVKEVLQYGQGCCCYTFVQRRENMEMVHTLLIEHASLDEPLYIKEFSSTRFSLLFQTGVISSEVTKEKLNMSDGFSGLEDSAREGTAVVNNNEKFTTIGWYKRGNVRDKTVLTQLANDSSNSSRYQSQSTQADEVENSTLTYHPCVIRPTNPNFFVKDSSHEKALRAKKYSVEKLL